MSAQVTEEHIYTTAKVGKAYVAGEDAQAAQLIADSEARAVAEIAMVAAESANRNVSLRLERDQLRAECINLRADLDAIKAIRDEEKARAERAEAELATEREKAERYRLASLKLDAELAAERARLDWLTMNTHVEPEECRGGSFSEGGTLWYSCRFISPRHAGHHASAAIDAAMKEGAK